MKHRQPLTNRDHEPSRALGHHDTKTLQLKSIWLHDCLKKSRQTTIAFQGTHEERFLNVDRLPKDIAMQSTVER